MDESGVGLISGIMAKLAMAAEGGQLTPENCGEQLVDFLNAVLPALAGSDGLVPYSLAADLTTLGAQLAPLREKRVPPPRRERLIAYRHEHQLGHIS